MFEDDLPSEEDKDDGVVVEECKQSNEQIQQRID